MNKSASWIDRYRDDPLHAITVWRPRAAPSGLDITPMIDITFLLLIFFLVASRPDTQAQARLPTARHGTGLSKRSAVILTVAQTGFETAPVYLGEGKVAAHRLPRDPALQRDRIERYVRDGLARGRSHVLIEADPGLAYGEVARVAAAAAHVPGIQLHFAVLDAD